MFPFRNKADDVDDVLDVEAYVRQRTGHAGIVAGLLIFFGFFCFGGPTGSGGFYAGDLLFHCALRLGGLGMVGVAIWMSIGIRSALVGDGILSALIGLLLAAGVILKAVTAGHGYGYIYYFIYLVCGLTFIVNGLRTLHDYLLLVKLDSTDDAEGIDELARARQAGHQPAGAAPEITEHAAGRPAPQGHRRKDSPAPSSSPGTFIRLSEEQEPRRH